MGTLRVLVADDHRLMLVAVRRALADAADFEIVGEVSVGSQVVPAARETKPDVVLLDLRMPELDGIGLQEELIRRRIEIPTVFLSAYGDVIHRDGDVVTLRVPKVETARVTARLLAEQEVLDLNVEDPPIEDVIELVFAQEQPER